MKIARRMDWFVVIAASAVAASCSGNGCGGCLATEPIPGGFPAAKRAPNAGQVRVSQTGLGAISADPAALIGALAGGMNGVVDFNVPASCGGSTPICCPGGVAKNPCGPIEIDLTLHPGDQPRLELHPKQGAGELDVTVRARVKTGMDIPVTVPVIGDCGVHLDTAPGPKPDLQIDAPIQLVQDATSGTTRITVGTVALTNLTTDDVSLTGGFGCAIANLGLSFFLDTLTSTLTSQIQSTIQDQTCKKCPSGQVAECGSSFATACTGNVCMEGNQCLQELGLDGRMRGSSLFGGFSPGTTGALDLYMVAGGYGTSNNNGLALGLLGGMQPGGAARDTCGPPSNEPSPVTIPQSAFFQGNTRPDTGAAFDVAIGLHKSQLDQFAFAGYNGGLLCLTLTHSTVAQLSTDTLSLLSRSLKNLVESSSPMAVGLRPQSPPVIALGTNTFTDNGMGGKTLQDPLLDIKFTAMEIDFFAAVDDQYVRVFTVVSDVHLPVGLQVTAMGQITPVIGNPSDAFTNVSVKNSDAVTETPDELAGLFPSILGLVLPQLSGGLGSINLPSLGGLNIEVTDITAVDNKSFLAIFGNLAPATFARPVKTTAEIASIVEPSATIAKNPRLWKSANPPRVELQLGGSAPDLEWSWRIDDGTWTAWSTNPRPTITTNVFWLPGIHRIDVRARQQNQPETIDTLPVVLEVPLGIPQVAQRGGGAANFHGQGGPGGCTCETSRASDSAPFALALALILLPLRRLRRRVVRHLVRLGPVVCVVAALCLPGCNCGSSSSQCSGDNCGTPLAPGGVGRWTSIAGDDSRVIVATYDQTFGDLLAVDVTDPSKMVFTAVDGVPSGGMPTYDPSGFRGGIEDPGPNVGAWTSIAMTGGAARIAYQDRDAGALKFATEGSPGSWSSYVLDAGNGEQVGVMTSTIVDGQGHPVVAYLGVGTDDGMGHRVTELRLAHAASASPSMGDWATSTIASAPGTCAGLCGTGETCAAPTKPTDPEQCVAATTDCTPACGSSSVCSMGTCRTAIADPTVEDIPTGTGLWARLVLLPDGRLAAVYYDRTRRSLIINVESGAGSGQFAETVLDGGGATDRGMWASAVVDGSGTIHIAYQDGLGDQLMYTTWNGNPGTPEVVDDGQRAGDRPHNVGAAASIYLVSGSPAIAYQDGLTADVYVATRSGSGWAQSALATGPLLDGFSIAATTGHGTPVLAWDSLDPSQSPPNTLAVQSP
jgi:hypothetical protein